MAMGAADSVPGVSGGTIAVIARIYDELIYSIRSVNIIALRLLYTDGIKRAWSYINGTFLLVLLCGIVISLRISASLVLQILDNYFALLMAFFAGLVIASSWLLKTEFGNWNWKILTALLAGMALTLIVSSLSPQSVSISNWYLFCCGVIAICAMILPGLSGAFLLIMLGVYDYVLNAWVNFEIETITIFIAGCISGLLIFSRFLAWTLNRYHDVSYAFLTGMLLSSVYVLWPWQQALSFYTDENGQSHVLQTANILPGTYQLLTGEDPQLMPALLCLLGGCAVIFIFDKLFRKTVD
jgi:putative membrane protein